MLMIIFCDQFFRYLNRGVDTPLTAFLARQFTHPEWYGFHFYDIVMPLFLFVVGAVIPYSLSRIKDGSSDLKPVYQRLLRRFVILFILGWIVQGNLLAWDSNTFKIFSNTLQAIAVGYVASSLAYLHLKPKARYIMFALCLLIYAVILTLPSVPEFGRSVLRPDQNFAIYFDRLIMGGWDDGTQYTWLLTGFGFTATTLSGMFAGELIRSSLPRPKVAQYLFLIGIAGIALGLIWGIWHPIVKKLWTSSFVLFLSGICFVLLAIFYYVIDVKGYNKWIFPLKVIGMNAITAYVLSHVISFSDIADDVLFGLESFVPAFYPLIKATGGFLILYALLWYMYKNKTFVKV
ncbi:DUF5009 domain-containing protein [Membranihabitans marinus]